MWVLVLLNCYALFPYLKRGLMDVKLERHSTKTGYLYSEWFNIRVAPLCDVTDESGQFWKETYEMRMWTKTNKR